MFQFDKYTEDEIDQIRAGIAAGLTYLDIAVKLPGRTDKGVRNKAQRMGLVARRPGKSISEKAQRDALRRAAKELEREQEESIVGQDEAFQAAMRAAIAAGLERVDEGISLVPCTEYPIFIRPQPVVFSRSPSLMCAETGDA